VEGERYIVVVVVVVVVFIPFQRAFTTAAMPGELGSGEPAFLSTYIERDIYLRGQVDEG
jgi:hypothetical protein